MNLDEAIEALAKCEASGQTIGGLWKEIVKLMLRSKITRKRAHEMRRELHSAGKLLTEANN
jgi:hypothetical protein